MRTIRGARLTVRLGAIGAGLLTLALAAAWLYPLL